MEHHYILDRYRAILDAITWLEEQNIAVIDFETTGILNPHAVQVAIIDSKGDTLLSELVKTDEPIHPKALAVHGKTPEMLAEKGINPVDMLGKIREIAGNHTLVAYNYQFERKVMRVMSAHYQRHEQLAMENILCAQALYAKFYGQPNYKYNEYKWHKLTLACKRQGIAVEDAHDALGDVKMTLALIKSIAETSLNYKASE